MEFEYTGTDNLEIMQKAVNYNAFLVSLIVRQGLSPSDKILDIGAGIGSFAGALREKGFDVHCLEPDMKQAGLLRSKGFAVSVTWDEIAGRSFDFIYALNVLEHIEKDGDALREWAGKLKDGGRMLIYVPAFNLLYSGMDRKVGHWRRYRRKELEGIIQGAGLRIVGRARYADCVGFFVSLLYRLLQKQGDINERSLVFYDRYLFPFSLAGDLLFHNFFGKNVFVVAGKLVRG
jgi:SAM-dependent methyltransferase